MSGAAHEILTTALGATIVRPAMPADAVLDRAPTVLLEPRTVEEVAEALAVATREDIALVVRGGGTKLDWGSPPGRCDAILSTRGLDRLVEYEPGDMTCVAEAGLPLVDLQDRLSAEPGFAQRLMVDAHAPAATLGGTVATNASGPRRTRYGTPRDLLIGVRYITGDGLAARSGGKVVKNVAGYDVAKLLTGSLGTLAVITETAWKLHPEPTATRTLVLHQPDAQAMVDLCRALRTAPVTPTAAEVCWPEGTLTVRIESTPEGAQAQADHVRGLGGTTVDELAQDDAIEREQLQRGRIWDGSTPVVAVGVRPSRLAGLLGAVTDTGGVLLARATIGSGDIGLPDEDPERLRRLVAALAALDASVRIRRAPVALRPLEPAIDDAGVLGVSSALKRELDPAAILAPGREPSAA